LICQVELCGRAAPDSQFVDPHLRWGPECGGFPSQTTSPGPSSCRAGPLADRGGPEYWLASQLLSRDRGGQLIELLSCWSFTAFKIVAPSLSVGLHWSKLVEINHLFF